MNNGNVQVVESNYASLVMPSLMGKLTNCVPKGQRYCYAPILGVGVFLPVNTHDLRYYKRIKIWDKRMQTGEEK